MSNSGKKMVYLRKKGTSGKQTIEFTYADANYLHLDRRFNLGRGGGYMFSSENRNFIFTGYMFMDMTNQHFFFHFTSISF